MDNLKLVSKKSKKQIEKRLLLIKKYPTHNKALTGFNLTLFRIRIRDNNIEKRIIYTIKNNEIILLAILERKHDYKDLKQILDKFNL